MIEPVLHVQFRVVAYDCSGYGDDRSREFTDGEEAVKYARGLEKRFGARVFKCITMDPISIPVPIDEAPGAPDPVSAAAS